MRTFLTAEQKVAIVREHLLEKVPVSDLCGKHGIRSVDFFNWQRQLFENGAACFVRKKNAANQRRQNATSERRVEQLETKIRSKNEVITELLLEHAKLKMITGKPEASLSSS
jgi:transposase-like protein